MSSLSLLTPSLLSVVVVGGTLNGTVERKVVEDLDLNRRFGIQGATALKGGQTVRDHSVTDQVDQDGSSNSTPCYMSFLTLDPREAKDQSRVESLGQKWDIHSWGWLTEDFPKPRTAIVQKGVSLGVGVAGDLTCCQK